MSHATHTSFHSTIQLYIISDVPISPSLVERLSARIDGPIFGHSSPLMSAPDSFQVVIEGLLVETGASTGAYAEAPNLQLFS